MFITNQIPKSLRNKLARNSLEYIRLRNFTKYINHI